MSFPEKLPCRRNHAGLRRAHLDHHVLRRFQLPSDPAVPIVSNIPLRIPFLKSASGLTLSALGDAGLTVLTDAIFLSSRPQEGNIDGIAFLHSA